YMLDQFRQWNLPVVVSDDDVGDRGVVARDPRVLLLLDREQVADAVGVAFADEHDSGPADNPVHDVLVLGEPHTGLGVPAALEHVQRPGGSTDLTLDLCVRRSLGATP